VTYRGRNRSTLRGFMGSVKETDHLEILKVNGMTLKRLEISRIIEGVLDSSG
jgi:hypothetical protein